MSDTKPTPLLLAVDVTPKSLTDRASFESALVRLAAADKSLQLAMDPERDASQVKGTTEEHLELANEFLTREFGIEIEFGEFRIIYRETITRKVEHDYTHKKQTGGSGQYARVKIRFEPGAPGSGFEFENEVVGGAVPKEYVPGVEKGLKTAKETGVIAGFPLIDFKATLIDGAYHDVDSNVLTFEIASRACFREGIAKAGPKLLEPIMRVEVVTPEEFVGDVIGDLHSRRGQISGGMDQRGNARVIGGMVPLANMFGYVSTLRSMTQGRAQYTMHFDHYEQVPPSIADEVRAKLA